MFINLLNEAWDACFSPQSCLQAGQPESKTLIPEELDAETNRKRSPADPL